MISIKNMPTRLADFSGGLNTKIKELNGMKLTDTPDCMDVYADTDGSLHKRNGRTKLNTSAISSGSNNCNLLYDLGGIATSVFGKTLSKMDELDGTWDSLDTDMSDCKHFADNFSGTLILGSFNYGIPSSWDGVSATKTVLTDAPYARYPKVWQNYIWWWNVKNNTSRLQRSNYGSISAYTAIDYNDVPTHDGDFGTGIAILKGVMFIFKRWSIHRVSYLGGTPLVDIRQMTNGVGTISHDTIKNVTIPGKGEVLIFLNADKRLFMFDGYNATSISDKFEEDNGICPISLKTMNTGGMKFAHATVDESNHWYLLFVPNGGTSTITHTMVYNYYTGACWPFSGQTLSSSTSMVDSNNKKWIIVGDYDGYAYKWNYGNRDNTTTISAYHTTPRIFNKTPSILNKNAYIRLDLRTISDDTLSFYSREDYNESWGTAETVALYNSSGEYYLGTTFKLGTATLGPNKQIVHKEISLPLLSNFMQFKISDSLITRPWTLYAYDFLGMGIGYGTQDYT